MNRLKFLLGALVVAVVSLGIYSCAKDNNPALNVNNDFATQNRSVSISGDCLSVLASECTGELQIDNIDFDVECQDQRVLTPFC